VEIEQPLPILDGRYQLLRRIGEGGMGAVFEARHVGTSRRVAVKIIADESLSKNPEVVDRFRREALAGGAIESQHIAHVTDTGIDPASGKPYLVMELLSGEDLEQAFHRVKPFPPDLALRVAAQACLGLQRAHEEGVVHRDIKPANLFLARRDRDVGELVVKILDFGIAKTRTGPLPADALTSTLTKTGGGMVGSPLYMSPEQALGRKTIDHRTDIWSIGVVLYEALTGTAPHASAETVGELIVSICHQPARLVQELAPWVPPEVAAIVHRALAIDPAARFASAKEMFAAIRTTQSRGYLIDEAMVAPIGSEARAVQEPSFFPPPALRVPAPSSGSLPEAVSPDESGAMRLSRAGGTEPGPPVAGSARSRVAISVAVAAAVAALGVGAYVLASRGSDAQDAAATVRASHLGTAASPPMASTPRVRRETPWVAVEESHEPPTISIDALPRVASPAAPLATRGDAGQVAHPATSASAGSPPTAASVEAGTTTSIDGF
jgi:serine/threonine-protein kinase